MIIIFTDGSSRGNPGPGGYGAILIFKNEDRVYELGGRESETTNNRMELLAVIESLKKINDETSLVEIYTDSSYLINGITKWIKAWNKNNWKTKEKKDVLNKDLWQQLQKGIEGKKIKFNHIAGHAGIAGNERADQIATSFADNDPTRLYRGSLENYSKDILNFAQTKTVSAKSSKSKTGKAYSYISMVSGKIETHKTWEECKKRVMGKNAKFKKALSALEEQSIINEFKKL